MTREQAIEHGKEQLEIFGGEHREFIEMALKALEQEPTTKNCESCRYYGSHHEVCNYCYKCSLWTEQKPTTKNDLAGDIMDFPNTFDEFVKDYGFKDKQEVYTNGSELIPVFRVKQWLEHISTTKKDLVGEFEGIEVTYPPEEVCIYPEYKGKPYFGIKHKENGEEIVGYGTYNPEVLSRYLKDYFISTTKNDLGVDCVARQDVERYIEGFVNEYTPKEELEFINLELDGLKHIPSVTPQLSSELEKNSKKLEKNFGELDCISRKAVIDELKRYFHDEYYQRTSIQNCRDCFIEDVLNHLPSVTPQEPRWIPVSERLPKEFETVILSTDKDEVFVGDYLGKMNDGTDCFDDNDGMAWEGNVIAWMPLPEGYKESEK